MDEKPQGEFIGNRLLYRNDLFSSTECFGFPEPDLFDRFAHSGRRLLAIVSSAAVAACRFRHVGATVDGSL
jgi:hypothetical protein